MTDIKEPLGYGSSEKRWFLTSDRGFLRCPPCWVPLLCWRHSQSSAEFTTFQAHGVKYQPITMDVCCPSPH